MTPEERAYFALAQHIGLEGNLIGGLTKEMERRVAEQIRAAIAEEREVCAKIADAHFNAELVAQRIRART